MPLHDSPKYVLTEETITLPDGTTLHRLRALRNIGDGGPGSVRKGDLGGFIESEKNLSHQDHCWVYDDACVYGQARVAEDAQVLEQAVVHGQALLLGNAQAFGRCRVGGHARVLDNAQIFGEAEVSGHVLISENGKVYGNAVLRDVVWVRGDAHVYGTARAIELAVAGGSRFAAQLPADGCANGTVVLAEGLVAGGDDPFATFATYILATCARHEVKEVDWGGRLPLRSCVGLPVHSRVIWTR
jgi:carbonic anhydrase/acetyltransferase-like protein (isoleucine patch superfamily)